MRIFNRDFMNFLKFPENMKRMAFKKVWMYVATLRRQFRSSLATKFVAIGIKPFAKHTFLKREDWEQFTQLQSTQEAIEKSEKGKDLWKKNKLDHPLGPTSYEGAIPKWQAEDARLLTRTRPFLRARGKLTKSGQLSFRSNETELVC